MLLRASLHSSFELLCALLSKKCQFPFKILSQLSGKPLQVQYLTIALINESFSMWTAGTVKHVKRYPPLHLAPTPLHKGLETVHINKTKGLLTRTNPLRRNICHTLFLRFISESLAGDAASKHSFHQRSVSRKNSKAYALSLNFESQAHEYHDLFLN